MLKRKKIMILGVCSLIFWAAAFDLVFAHGSEGHGDRSNSTKITKHNKWKTSVTGTVMEIYDTEIKIKQPGGAPTYVMYDEQTIFERKNQKVSVNVLRKNDHIVIQGMIDGAKFHALKVLIGKRKAAEEP